VAPSRSTNVCKGRVRWVLPAAVMIAFLISNAGRTMCECPQDSRIDLPLARFRVFHRTLLTRLVKLAKSGTLGAMIPRVTRNNICTSVLVLVCVTGFVAAAMAEEIEPARDTNSIVLPSRHIEPDGIFLLQASIAGEKSLNLFLDTGAGTLVISEPLARRLRKAGKLRNLGRIRMLASSGDAPKMTLVELTDFQCGQLAVRHPVAVVADLTTLSEVMGEPVDGFAGMSLFGSNTLVLDYPAKEVRIETSPEPNTNGAAVVPFDFKGGVPMVGFECAGQRFTAMGDSGCKSGLSVPFTGRHFPFLTQPRVVGSVASVSGVSDDKAARLATNFYWGGLTFEHPVVRLARTKFGLVGIEVFRHFVVKLDLGTSKLWLTPGTNGAITSPPVRSAGLSLLPVPQEHCLKVATVIPNTDAARAGLRPGSRITAIDGEAAQDWSEKRWHALVERAQEIEVEVAGGSKTRRVKLRVQVLVE
jgi:hypothetical protein